MSSEFRMFVPSRFSPWRHNCHSSSIGKETMQIQEYIGQELKLRDRESPTAAGAAPPLNEAKRRSKVPRFPSASVIDFFEASDRVPARSQDCGKDPEINSKASGFAVRRLPSVQRVDRLEDSLYWFSSGATLVYLLLEFLGR
jgi:hypothetical protein